MNLVNKIAWYGFILYFGGILLLAVFFEIEGFLEGGFGLFDPYAGRSEFYLDQMHD